MNPFLFTVLTDFRFEIGSALLGTNQLRNAVDGVSESADNALLSFQRLGAGIVFNMGLGSGGIASVLHAAVQASDKFTQTQLSMANLIAANREHLIGPIDSFNEKLTVSRQIMAEIGKTATKFGLSGSDMMNTVKFTSAALIPKGLAGDNMGTAIEMARGLLKSAPNLGIDTFEVQGQLMRSIEGGASMGDTLFRRLVADVPKAFGSMAGPNAAKMFNAAPAAKRVEMLNKALTALANNAEVNEARANSLSGVMQKFKNMLSPTEYLTNIFRPLGDVLVPFLVKTLNMIADVLQKDGARIVQNIAHFITDFLKGPEQLIVNLLQLRNAGKDLHKTGNLFSIAGVIVGIGHALKFLGITSALAVPWLGPLVLVFGGLFEMLGRAEPLMAEIMKFVFGFGALLAVAVMFPVVAIFFVKLAAVAAAVFAFMQLISRAQAIAQVDDAKAMPELMSEFTEVMVILKQTVFNILKPFWGLFEAIAQFISPLFRMSFYLGIVNGLIWGLAWGLSVLQSGFMGLLSAVQAFMNYFTSSEMLRNPLGLGKAVSEAFSGTFEENMRKNLTLPGGPDDIKNPATMANVNIAKIEIRNDFKEQQEPDRVAFTMKDQLMKAALNPTQARGRGLGNGLVGV